MCAIPREDLRKRWLGTRRHDREFPIEEVGRQGEAETDQADRA